VSLVCSLLERGYLEEGPGYLCSGQPTIADLAAYEELAQLRPAHLFDFEAHPRVRGWLERMDALPFCDAVHRYNEALGDILTEPNTFARFKRANVAGLEALEACGVEVRR
jgi:hypothetical protein